MPYIPTNPPMPRGRNRTWRNMPKKPPPEYVSEDGYSHSWLWVVLVIVAAIVIVVKGVIQ